jgi:hypothetical protein
MNKHISILSVLIILGGCVTAPISPEFTERLDDIDREKKVAGRENRKRPDEELKRQIREETELDRALQRLVDDLELAVMGLSDSEPNDKTGPGGEHLVKEGEYLDLIIEKTMPNSPIKSDLLRKAFVKLNPTAFGGRGNPNYLFAKKTLKIPSVDDLKTIIFNSGEMKELKTQSRDPHRGWIHYP